MGSRADTGRPREARSTSDKDNGNSKWQEQQEEGLSLG